MSFAEHKKEIEKYMYDALWHFLDHQCGAAFFKHPEKLFDIVYNQKPQNILEIGTGIGYSAFIMHCANKDSKLVTVEQEKDHCEIARAKLLRYSKNIEVINSKAEDILEKFKDSSFDLIFYDGYAPRVYFLKQFERILSKEGILISANSQKKGYKERDGSTKAEYLSGLDNKAVWDFQESFADVLVYKKISE